MRLTAAVVVAFAALISPAAAQDPTPTPTPTPTATPTPAPERSDAEQDVYRDYRRDGVIEACEHKKKTLKDVLEELPPEADLDTPDLRPALEAAIEQHSDGDCRGPEPTPTPTPTATPPPTSTPAPVAPAPTPVDPIDPGSVAPLPGGSGGGGTPTPPSSGDVAPLDPSVTPVPPAATPATPAPAAPPAPAEPSGPVATPQPVYSNADDELPISLLFLAGLLGLLALLALLFALANRFGWAQARLAGPRRAVSEAGFRAGGTWADFADWIRLGR